MQRGICKLCLQKSDLLDSHFIPAAMYKRLRNASTKNLNPVIVTSKVTSSTSRQIKHHLLCSDCEDRFNKNGEMEVLKWVSDGKRFPIVELLGRSVPFSMAQDFTVYSGTTVGIDTEKFAYFALSVVWRAAVHQWDLPFGGMT